MTPVDIAALGRRVAAHEDVTLWDLPRPSTSDRLAAVRRKQAAATRRAPRPATSSRWALALAASAAAVALFLFALHRSSRVGATAAAEAPPVSTAGCGGMEATSKTAGNAGSGG